jgi:hypothetical protein
MERGVIRPVIVALLLSVLALASIARAQQVAPGAASLPGGAPSGHGVIMGRVLDQDDHGPLPNARAGVYRLSAADSAWVMLHGSLTGADGSFHFDVPPGTYRVIFSYQSYSVLVKDNIAVAAGATVDMTVTLTPHPIQMKGVEVKGEEAKGSEATSLNKQRKADFVSDAITSEQIQKSTDSNAAEALQRVTGLSVVQGKYVFVRGLGERYSSTQVNGASVGTPEPNKKVVPLDVFPAGALDNITVQKTYTPDQEGEFAGGVIDLSTHDFVSGRSFTQTINVGYSVMTARFDYLSYPGGKLDFLGVDDGTRDYPESFKALAGDKRVATKGLFGGEGFTAEEVQGLGRSFNKIYTPIPQGGAPNYSYAGSYSKGTHVFGKETSFLGALTLGSNFATQRREVNAYSGTSTQLIPLYEYDVDESAMKVTGGAMANMSFRLAESHALRLRTLYTRSTDDVSRISQGPNHNFGTDLVRIQSLDFVERGLFLGVLSGEHKFAGAGNLRVDWRGSYSEAQRDEPDRRENWYESNGRGGIQLSQRQSLPITRIFGDMSEYDRAAALDVTKDLPSWTKTKSELKVGGAYRRRNRVSGFRRLGFKLGTTGRNVLDTSLPPESLLVDENIKPGYFELQEGTRENDTYTAEQTISAGYGMLKLPVTNKAELVVGARSETSDQFVEAKSPFVTTAEPVDVQLKDTDLLPAANLAYRFSERMNVRGGLSVTLSRPELREMSPFDMYDYETGYSEVGNPEIHSTRIENYDVRWEFFPGTRELLAVSGFRKLLYEPIENVVEGSSGGYILSPRNGRDGRLKGVELEGRFGLATAWNALPIGGAPHALERWAIQANYARVESSVRVRTTTAADGSPIYRKGPLQGQSTFSLNLGLFYGSNSLQSTLMMSQFGERLAQVGAGAYPSSLPDIYEHPMTSLDWTMSKSIGSKASLKVSAENLLDDHITFVQLGQLVRRYNPGRSFSLTMNFKG